MTKLEKISQIADKLKNIYSSYKNELAILQKEQDFVLDEFREKLEKKKIDALDEAIKSK